MYASAPWLIYVAAMMVIWLSYVGLRVRKHSRSEEVKQKAKKAGLTEPASLHPVINPNRCIGCQSCIFACPEQKNGSVLGLINGKAELVNPAHCIGHGACAAVCPVDAITLVFGTARRGVDLPQVKPNFETNVPGLFIAGELGGMGLIRNAIEQGRQALDSIARTLPSRNEKADLDVLIVGAGPAGLSASLAAMERKLKFVTVEQDSLGGTVFQFPRGKVVMTAPADLPLVGKVKFTETTKEALLEFWKKIVDQTGLEISFKERVEDVSPDETGEGFIVTTSRQSYHARTVLLAIGRRGTPRKLGVPGEDKPKVVYRLLDPEQYRNQHVLVVGGGDSALEAATSIADEPGAVVTLSYRAEAFSRAKEKNRHLVAAAEAAGKLKVLFKSSVKVIEDDSVTIEHEGNPLQIPNDTVIVCAGGVLPTPFLKKAGVQVETKYGAPLN